MIQRIRRFLGLISHAWALSGVDRAPIGAPEAYLREEREPFDFENDPYLFDLMQSATFRQVIRSIARGEAGGQVSYMRATVRQEQHTCSIRAEAAAQVFEDLPSVFDRYARRNNQAKGSLATGTAR